MKTEDFFLWLEGYYGKYDRTVLRNDVAVYIRNIPERELPLIKEYLKQSFSTQYNFTPDIATLEIARKDIKPAPTQKVYQLPPPDPEARDMKVEVGQLMEVVLLKVDKNIQAREKRNE